MYVLASAAGAQELLKNLQLITKNGSGFLTQVWSLFLQGDLYEIISFSAAPLLAVVLFIFIYNFFSNKNLNDTSQKAFTGDIISWVLIGIFIYGLFFPRSTGELLYSARQTGLNLNNRLVASANSFAKDPNLYLLTGLAGEQERSAAIAVCNREADPQIRDTCFKDLDSRQDLLDINSNVGLDKASDSFVYGARSKPNNDWILLILIPLLLTIGTAFLILLEAGQLIACLLLPYVLLYGIIDRNVVFDWIKKFWSWTLIKFAYSIIMISVSFALVFSQVDDSLLYALIAGVGAPILSYTVISGSGLGIFSGFGSAASTVSRLT